MLKYIPWLGLVVGLLLSSARRFLRTQWEGDSGGIPQCSDWSGLGGFWVPRPPGFWRGRLEIAL